MTVFLYADEKAYADNARAAGFDYVIGTTTTPAKGFSADQELSRLAANALVVGNADGEFNYTINFDVDLSPELSLDDPFDLVVCSDTLHYVRTSELVKGLEVLPELVAGVAYLDFLTSDDDLETGIEGDLVGFRMRRASWTSAAGSMMRAFAA